MAFWEKASHNGLALAQAVDELHQQGLDFFRRLPAVQDLFFDAHEGGRQYPSSSAGVRRFR